MEKQLISFVAKEGQMKTQGYLWELVSKSQVLSNGIIDIKTIAIVEDLSTKQLRQAELTEFEIIRN